MWRLLSNNVVLVSQQVDAVRATWRVCRLISISLLATRYAYSQIAYGKLCARLRYRAGKYTPLGSAI